MLEIRKLFGISQGEDNNLDTLVDHEHDNAEENHANDRLIDHILKIKLLLSDNRRLLEGNDDDESSLQ